MVLRMTPQNQPMGWRRGLRVGAAAIVIATAGCQDVGEQDAADRQLTLVRRAEAKRDEGDVEGAVELYNEALLGHPRAARTHLDLAILLHDAKRDLPAAIYHYRRYIELRPETEKADMIESRLRQAMQSLGAKGFEAHQQVEVHAQALARQNATLKLQVEKLQQKLMSQQNELDAAQKTIDRLRTAPATRTAGSSGGDAGDVARTYRVRRGDTLASIAAKVYGSEDQWHRIYEANREIIPDSDRLQVGTVLTIP